MKKLSSILLLALSSLSFNSFANMTENGFQCYWMENYSGKYEWVSTEDIGLGPMNKETCYSMDSCDGGEGFSGGGCYKWAQSAEGPRESWDFPAQR